MHFDKQWKTSFEKNPVFSALASRLNCSNEGLTFETSATHQIPSEKHTISTFVDQTRIHAFGSYDRNSYQNEEHSYKIRGYPLKRTGLTNISRV